MKKNKHIGIIGFGNMGKALGFALALSGWHVFVYDKIKSKCKKRKNIYPCKDPAALIENVSAVIVAIKPQDLKAFFSKSSVLKALKVSRPLLISIAAGVAISFYRKQLKHIAIVRVMPNLGALINQSVSCLCASKGVAQKQMNLALSVFKCVGDVHVVSETFIDKVTAISGSGPGYVFYIMDALYKSALRLGFPKRTARRMVQKTFIGASLIAGCDDSDFEILIRKVASRGGTTEAALRIFEKHKMKKIMDNAVKRAVLRAGQLQKQ